MLRSAGLCLAVEPNSGDISVTAQQLDWSANHREVCSCDFSCLLGDLNDGRQSFTISIYPCAMLLEKVNQLT